MPRLGPVSWRKFIAKIHKFGFDGPYQEGRHPYMIKGDITLTVPNPHDGDISQDLLMKLLRQAGISRNQWMSKS